MQMVMKQSCVLWDETLAVKFVSVFFFWFDLQFIHKSFSRSKGWLWNIWCEHQNYENSIGGIWWALGIVEISPTAISSRAVVEIPVVSVPWTTPRAKKLWYFYTNIWASTHCLAEKKNHHTTKKLKTYRRTSILTIPNGVTPKHNLWSLAMFHLLSSFLDENNSMFDSTTASTSIIMQCTIEQLVVGNRWNPVKT